MTHLLCRCSRSERDVITQQLRKVGNSYVVTVPKDEVERRGWHEGQLLALQLTELEVRPILRPELREIVDELLDEHEDALRYLAGR
jgi:antitoxin component of MazEF toxin-antitoxin module